MGCTDISRSKSLSRLTQAHFSSVNSRLAGCLKTSPRQSPPSWVKIKLHASLRRTLVARLEVKTTSMQFLFAVSFCFCPLLMEDYRKKFPSLRRCEDAVDERLAQLIVSKTPLTKGKRRSLPLKEDAGCEMEKTKEHLSWTCRLAFKILVQLELGFLATNRHMKL